MQYSIVSHVVRLARIVRHGEVFTFDRAEDRFLRNGKLVSPIGRIDYVQIRTFRSAEGADEYRLSVVLVDRTKTRIDQSMNAEKIIDPGGSNCRLRQLEDGQKVDTTTGGGVIPTCCRRNSFDA